MTVFSKDFFLFNTYLKPCSVQGRPSLCPRPRKSYRLVPKWIVSLNLHDHVVFVFLVEIVAHYWTHIYFQKMDLLLYFMGLQRARRKHVFFSGYGHSCCWSVQHLCLDISLWWESFAFWLHTSFSNINKNYNNFHQEIGQFCFIQDNTAWTTTNSFVSSKAILLGGATTCLVEPCVSAAAGKWLNLLRPIFGG